MLKKFNADLHIHSCLSPCADNEMTPVNIVNQAKKKNIDVIAITDHNSSENVFATQMAGKKVGLYVLAGMEVTTVEEVHILTFFENINILLEFQQIIYQNLEGRNDEEKFGMQIIMNQNDEIVGINEKLLIGATKLGIDELIEIVHLHNGIAIASHIDRDRFSIISQLGFIPENIKLDGFEISDKKNIKTFNLKNKVILNFSDAHFKEDIGKNYTGFLLKELSFKEIKMALKNENERRVIL